MGPGVELAPVPVPRFEWKVRLLPLTDRPNVGQSLSEHSSSQVEQTAHEATHYCAARCASFTARTQTAGLLVFNGGGLRFRV
jgi:hypothetical protein